MEIYKNELIRLNRQYKPKKKIFNCIYKKR